ncbi:hypothetical protein RI129_001004 [Pyrocoelia pectoralis]|uniref:CCHC-type domain-containing protein n=1 Tax=Pyrocoelia pectoralis TaxID=417401 RepID=A0AAN7VIZ3_9COLE
MSEETGGPGPPQNKPSNPLMDCSDENRYDLNNKYKECDIGPYVVFLQHKIKNIGRLFPVRVGFYLQKVNEFKNDILDIKPIGINRVKVIFKTYHIANSLINHEVVIENDLIAYIPKFFNHRKGVVRMVDTYFSEAYLVETIVSTIAVTEVKRLTRKVVDSNTNKTEFIKRQMIVATFAGNRIPDSIKINMVNFHVEPYIHPVIQCLKCLRYGHIQAQCKGKTRCNVINAQKNIQRM